jgi:3-oxoacyl-[acyl-carrier-protein] synthase III
MRFENLYIAGTGRRLPEPMTVDEAERAGLCERRLIWRTEIVSVCVASNESAPEMAAHAAGLALRQADCSSDEISLILHANTYYQGHDLWPPASYIQHVAVGNRCPAIEVRQMSNGGLAALELAASYLVADPARGQALVTTGDRFCPPGYDRWRTDPGTICGDGGTAAVLSTQQGYARLRSLVSVSDPSLEKIARGDDEFGPAPFSARMPIDLDAHRASLVREIGLDEVLDRIDAGQRETFKRALSDAEVELSDIDWFVLPSLGYGRLKAHFLDPFGIDPDRTTWSWGRQIGHLGAGDQIAGFGYLAESGNLLPGQRCLLAGVGAGFSWSAGVVEMIRLP